jgi:hypothetical protein
MFDRYNICEAYAVFSWHNAEGTEAKIKGRARSIQRQLDAIQFRPRPSLEYGTLRREAREIYDALCRRFGHPTQEETFVAWVQELLAELQPTIGDTDRAYEPDDDMDDEPGICVTVACATGCDGDGFAFQTGDPGYMGPCYGVPHWGTVSLLRSDSDLEAIARSAVDQCMDSIYSYLEP